MLLLKTQLPVRLASALAKIFFPLLIVTLGTASCASTSPSMTGSTAEHQQRNDKPGDDMPTESGLSPASKLIGTWECTLGYLPNYWKGEKRRVLIIREDGDKLVVLFGLNNIRLRKAEIVSYSNTLIISFKSHKEAKVELRLIKDDWLDGAMTTPEMFHHPMTCLKQ